MKDQAHTKAEDVDGTIIFANPVFEDLDDTTDELIAYHKGMAIEYCRELNAALEQNAHLREQLTETEVAAANARTELEMLKAWKPIVVESSAEDLALLEREMQRSGMSRPQDMVPIKKYQPRQYHRTEKEKTQDTIALVAKIRTKLERHGMGVFGQDDISVLAGAIAAGIEEALR